MEEKNLQEEIKKGLEELGDKLHRMKESYCSNYEASYGYIESSMEDCGNLSYRVRQLSEKLFPEFALELITRIKNNVSEDLRNDPGIYILFLDKLEQKFPDLDDAVYSDLLNFIKKGYYNDQ